jgi:hypothetical protein
LPAATHLFQSAPTGPRFKFLSAVNFELEARAIAAYEKTLTLAIAAMQTVVNEEHGIPTLAPVSP